METKKFKTRTEFIERDNGKISDKWLIAADIGYSSVKLFAPNKIVCFPSYAKRIDREPTFITEVDDDVILYKEQSGDLWAIGSFAQSLVSADDTSDSENALYGRNRYFNKMFDVIIDVALGIGMMKNNVASPSKNETVYIQTGLPEKYMDDEETFKDSLEGKHIFSLKVGKNDWEDFNIYIKRDHIDVMSQPQGTLFSTVLDKNGQFISNAEDYLKSNVIVFDPGFGTLDIFTLRKGRVDNGETFSDLGMRRVLEETSKLIKEKYKVIIPVPAMQECLDSGVVLYTNRREGVSKTYPIEELLATACFKVCEEAFNRMGGALNLGEFKYFIITGGTGEAWHNKLNGLLNGYSNLKVVYGNQNDNLPLLYSNVRGYYLTLFNKILIGK